MNNEKTTESFPPMGNSKLQEIKPQTILLLNLLEILQIVSGSLVVHAIPLVGGNDAKEELESWKLGVLNDDDAEFHKRESLSGYMTLALALFGIEKTVSNHLVSSEADAMKAIQEVTMNYHLYSHMIEPFRRIAKSKDITPTEKFDAFWTFTDLIYDEIKTHINQNAKQNPEAVEALIADITNLLLRLDRLTEGAKYLRIIPPPPPNNSNA